MKRVVFILTALFLGSSLMISCESEADPNDGIIPVTDSLLLRYSDTTTLIGFIEKDDTLRTDVTEFVILGSCHDPVFGKSTASFYSTFTMVQSVSSSTAVIDSIILTLKSEGGYGDLSKFTGYQMLRVYEVTEDITTPPADKGYNSYTSFAKNPVPIATYGFVPQFFPFGTTPACIRIPINPSFGTRLFQGDTINSTNIRDYIKGIYVTIDPAITASQPPGTGGFAYFKLNSDVSNMTIYLHDQPDIRLPMGTSSNYRFNHFEHDRSFADPAFISKLADTNNTTASDKLYIQGMEGTRVKIKMPYLKSYLDSGKVIVNKAELIIPIDASQNLTLYRNPGNLLTYMLSADRKVVLMEDVIYNYYDSYYDAVKQQYHFVITQYIQQVLNDEARSSEFYIDIPVGSKNTNAFRVVINSCEHATNPIQLNLTYTRIPQD